MMEHIFRCRKCREKLFDGCFIVTEHNVKMFTPAESDDTEEKTCSTSVGTLWYMSSNLIPDWIGETINKCQWTKGKINCPKCKGRLGSFDFLCIGKCPCRKSALPPLHILQNRVDHHLVMKVQKCDTKSNRFKQKIDRNDCQRNNDITYNNSGDVMVTEKSERNQKQDVISDDLPLSFIDHSSTKELEVTNNGSTTSDSLSDRLSQFSDVRLEDFSSAATGKSSRLANNKSNSITSQSTTGPLPRLHNNRLEHLSNVSTCNRYNYLAVDEEEAIVGDENTSNHGNKARARDSMPSITTSNRFIKLDEEDDHEENQNMDDDLMYPDEHTCAVCYELYCSPMKCNPCNHVFCECCLRLLGKRMSAMRMLCPLCRSTITKCDRDKDMIITLQDLYENEYKTRLRQQRKFLGKKFYPLPHESGGGMPQRHCNNRVGRRGRHHPPANNRQPTLNYMSFFIVLWVLIICIGLLIGGFVKVMTFMLSPFLLIYDLLSRLKNLRPSRNICIVVGAFLAVGLGVVIIEFMNIKYIGH